MTLERKLATVEDSEWNRANNLAYCHPGTRLKLLERLGAWSLDSDGPRLFWITGLAGTGKSTISRSFCRALDDESLNGSAKRLAGSFFISRHVKKHRDACAIVQSFAYGLALRDKRVRLKVLDALKKDPQLLKAQLSKQVELLIAQPLQKALPRNSPLVLVIDALDECDLDARDAEARHLIPLLARALTASAYVVKLLVTSRPECRLRDIFRSIPMTHQLLSLHDDNPSIGSVASDIQVYLQESLACIAQSKGIPLPWPSENAMDKLVTRSGELFIFASTVLLFVGNPLKNPAIQLQAILASPGESSQSLGVYHGLDTLYTSILTGCFTINGQIDESSCALFRSLVGSVVVSLKPLSTLAWSMLLDKDHISVEAMIAQLYAVLLSAPSNNVRILHPSFPEYLLSSTRCCSQHFLIQSQQQHLQTAHACLRHMNKTLQSVIWDIETVPIMNSDIGDLDEHIHTHVHESLQYACHHWMAHVAQGITISSVEENNASFLTELACFCSTKLIIWVEVASLLGGLSSLIASLSAVITLLKVSSIARMLRCHC